MKGKAYKRSTTFLWKEEKDISWEKSAKKNVRNVRISVKKKGKDFFYIWGNMDWKRKRVYVLSLVDILDVNVRKQDREVSRRGRSLG
jgi:hypothetical protein